MRSSANKSAKSVLVIGYGNPLRGDDGLGCVVADALLDRQDMQVVCTHQLTPEIAEPLSRASLAIFVDATVDGVAGRIRCEVAEPSAESMNALGHHLSPERLLGYAKSLYGKAPRRAWTLSVAGKAWGYREGLSDVVQRAVPKVLHEIDRLIEEE